VELRFVIMVDEISEDTQEPDKRPRGPQVLGWAETQMMPLRGTQAHSHKWSYHALADEVRIGWHPDYQGMFGVAKNE